VYCISSHCHVFMNQLSFQSIL